MNAYAEFYTVRNVFILIVNRSETAKVKLPAFAVSIQVSVSKICLDGEYISVAVYWLFFPPNPEF
jgi:hypothetical protein